jgi:hypothetical protein
VIKTKRYSTCDLKDNPEQLCDFELVVSPRLNDRGTYARRLHLLQKHEDRGQMGEIGCGALADGIDRRDDFIPNSLKIFIVRRMSVQSKVGK